MSLMKNHRGFSKPPVRRLTVKALLTGAGRFSKPPMRRLTKSKSGVSAA